MVKFGILGYLWLQGPLGVIDWRHRVCLWLGGLMGGWCWGLQNADVGDGRVKDLRLHPCTVGTHFTHVTCPSWWAASSVQFVKAKAHLKTLFETFLSGNCLAVQWLGLRAFTTEGPGSIPGGGTKILQATGSNQKKKRNLRLPFLRFPTLVKVLWKDQVLEFSKVTSC